jgi:hypothetical protein
MKPKNTHIRLAEPEPYDLWQMERFGNVLQSKKPLLSNEDYEEREVDVMSARSADHFENSHNAEDLKS